jgi:hypothetical protein
LQIETNLHDKIKDLKTAKIKFTNTVDFVPLRIKDDTIVLELNQDKTIK